MEAFVVSFGKLLNCAGIPNRLAQSIMITKNGNHKVKKTINDFSAGIQKEILLPLKQAADEMALTIIQF